MWKGIAAAVIIAILVAPVAFAGRAEDLRARYNTLQAQREEALIEMRRIEGIFIEIQYQAAQVKAEVKEEAVVEPEEVVVPAVVMPTTINEEIVGTTIE